MSKADLASVTVNGVKIEAYASKFIMPSPSFRPSSRDKYDLLSFCSTVTDAPNGNVTGKLYAVPNLACNAVSRL